MMAKSRSSRTPWILALVAVGATAASSGHISAQPAPTDLRQSFDIRTTKDEATADYREKHFALGDQSRTAALRATGRARLEADISGIVVEKSPTLDVPEIVSAKAGSTFLTGPSDDRAAALRGFLATYADAYGLSSDDLSTLQVVADYENPSGNMGWVELEQRINGLPVFHGYLRGGFTAKGELVRTTGQLAPGLPAESLTPSPSLTAAQAVTRAAAHVGWKVPEAALAEKSVDDEGRITLAKGPMADDARAWLLYFPLAPGVARLAWATEIWGDPDVFFVLLDAEDGTVLFRKYLTSSQSQTATYVVYDDDSPAPSSPTPALPGANYQAPWIGRSTFTVTGAESPNTFNNLGWMTDGTNLTDGNNVQAGLDRDGVNGVDAAVIGASRVFNFTYDPQTQEALTTAYQQGDVTNLFYWTNRYHDSLYLLGFTEAARNFQNDNFGRGGVGNDRISAEAQDSSGTNNANFATPADGGRGRMQMYLWPNPAPDRSGGLDRDIVIHELTHGLSNRLHANGSGLNTTMAGGMGEGWSDFYARALYATASESTAGIYTVGGWATYLATGGYTDNYYYGIRRFPYAVRTTVGSNGLPHNPLTFADVDPAQINITDGAYPRGPFGSSSAYAVHNVGEIWAMSLFEVRARFINRLGFAIGNQRMLQFVTDGMKLDPANPTMIQARDAILAAATAGGGTAADIADIWAGFAARGMGTLATVNNVSTGSVTESFTVPGAAVPTFTVNDPSVTEGNAGTTTLNFTVTLTNPNASESRVNFATADGSATGSTTVTTVGPITVPGSGTGASTGSPSNPYPLTFAVAGLGGSIQSLAVRLNGVTHTYAGDMDILLVAPGGQKIMLLSDVGNGESISNLNLTFRDGSPAAGTGLTSTTYAPTDLVPGETMVAPAPAGPYGTALSVLNGTNPNGTWQLYVQDDASADVGTIAGFSLLVTTSVNDYVPASGQLSFPAGITTRTVSVPVNGDTVVEPNETLTLNLSSPLNAVIGDATGVGTIVNDDGGVPATMITPVNGAAIPNPTTFTWTTGTGVLEYWLYVGTTPGGTDIYNATNGLVTSRSVAGIPQTGANVYVTLWSRLASGWTYNQYTYIGGGVGATMVTPVNGATIATPTTFTWTTGTAALEYWLYVGTTPGGAEIYNATNGLVTSRSVTGIPQTGANIYVTLWTRLVSGWVLNQYTYVGGSPLATMVSPVPGSVLTSSTTTFTWTPGNAVTQIWLYVGTTVGGTQIYNASQGTATSRTVSGLPNTNVPVYVRLWSLRAGLWNYIDYTYQSVDHRSRLLTPAVGGTLPGATATFRWTTGSGVTQRWLYVGTTPGGANLYNADQSTYTERTVGGLPTTGVTLYARLWSLINGAWYYIDYSFRGADPVAARMSTPADGTTLPGASATLNWSIPGGVTQVWLYVGTTVGGSNIVNVNKALVTSHLVTGLPVNGSSVYVRLWSLIGGLWQYIDYKFHAAGGSQGVLLMPAVGGTLPGSTATFRWTAGPGVNNTWLYVGTSPGAANLYNAEQLTLTERTVSGLPTTGVPLYARLWSLLGTGWQFTDYQFRAADPNIAALTSPAWGSKLTSTSATFTWTIPGATTSTWIYIGTSVGGFNLANVNTGTATSYAASSLPNDGSPIYMRLWSFQGGSWKWVDYHFTAAGAAIVGDDTLAAADVAPVPR